MDEHATSTDIEQGESAASDTAAGRGFGRWVGGHSPSGAAVVGAASGAGGWGWFVTAIALGAFPLVAVEPSAALALAYTAAAGILIGLLAGAIVGGRGLGSIGLGAAILGWLAAWLGPLLLGSAIVAPPGALVPAIATGVVVVAAGYAAGRRRGRPLPGDRFIVAFGLLAAIVWILLVLTAGTAG